MLAESITNMKKELSKLNLLLSLYYYDRFVNNPEIELELMEMKSELMELEF